MNNIFNINRFYKLLKFKYALHSRSLFIQVGGITALFLIISGLVIYNHDGGSARDLIEYFSGMWIAILFAGGCYLTSKTFSTLQDTSKGFFFMQLPVSTFEKLLFPLLSTGIVFVALHTVLYTILVKVQLVMWGMFVELPEVEFSLFQNPYWILMKAYLIIQPIFLLGALFFKRFNFVLTNISLFIIPFVSFWLLALIFYLSFGKMNPDNFKGINIDNPDPNAWWGYLIGGVIWLVFVSASYFKLKEKEV